MLLDMFKELENSPITQEIESTNNDYANMNPMYHDPTFVEQPPSNWQDEFVGYRSAPVLYNIDGYIAPYASNNWGGTSNILQHLDDESRLPPVDKVDPNRIFTSDISALRTLAADQSRVTKLFEKKLIEGLADRNKNCLNESDIMAMQALTAARNAITSINKEQIAIKKNIADLRIKQNSNTGSSSSNNGGGGGSISSRDVGRSILDQIFDTPAYNTPTPVVTDYQPASLEAASQILDDIIPTSESNAHILYENDSPTTYVTIGEDPNDLEYVTYSSSGELLADYPNPSSKIVDVDLNSMIATDDLMVTYPIRKN